MPTFRSHPGLLSITPSKVEVSKHFRHLRIQAESGFSRWGTETQEGKPRAEIWAAAREMPGGFAEHQVLCDDGPDPSAREENSRWLYSGLHTLYCTTKRGLSPSCCLELFVFSRALSKIDDKYPCAFPGGSAVKNQLQSRRSGSHPWVGNPLEEGRATPSSILAGRIPLDRGVWPATGRGITRSPTQWTRDYCTSEPRLADSQLQNSSPCRAF